MEISKKNNKILKSMSTNDIGVDTIKRWPMISNKGDKIFLATFDEPRSKETTTFKVFLFDKATKEIQLQKEEELNAGGLWGAYPYFNKFVLFGVEDYICVQQIPRYLLAAHLPVYHHNYSFITDDKSKLEKQFIQEKGCYNVTNSAYDVSSSGEVHTVWIQKTDGEEHDEIVYYSVNKDGIGWTKPTELYSVKSTKKYMHISNLSLSSTDKSAFVLWHDTEKGLFFSEIRDGEIVEVDVISDMKTKAIFQDPFSMASTVRISSDNNGNSYAIWAQNSGHDYKLLFRAKKDGKLTETITINSGKGYVKLPDIKVDKQGTVHIAYIKPINPNEVKKTIGVGKHGCFYLRLEPYRGEK